MTLNDLKKEVIALGFEEEVGSHETFLHSAKRAISTLFSDYDFPMSAKLRIPSRAPVFYRDTITVSGEERISTSGGKAYSFCAVGEGFFVIQDDEENFAVQIPEGEHIYKGFLRGEDTSIRFYGSYEFTVYNFAVFDTLYGKKEESIPLYTERITINPRTELSDFCSFLSPITDACGRLIEHASEDGGNITLPRSFSGTLCFSYKRLAPKITDTPEAKIEIPEEGAHLLALLTAAYVWLDDDPDKATYYMTLYKDGLKTLRQARRSSFTGGYEDVTGWA